MIAAWTVAINLITRSNFGMVASNIGREAGLLENKLNGVNRQMNRTQALTKAAAATFDAFTLAAAASAAIGVKGAIDLQNAMNGIKVATGASAAEMVKLRDIALSMSRITGQSWGGAAGSLSTLIQGGIPYKQLIANPGFALRSAQFMDVMKYGSHHVPYEESSALITKIAHQLNTYSAAQIGPVLDLLAGGQYQQADSIVQAASQLKYFAPLSAGVRVSPQDEIVLLSMLGRFGMATGRGGTGVRSFIDRQFNPRSKAGRSAMEDLGLYGPHGPTMLDEHGQFQIFGAFKHLADLFEDWTKRYGAREAERRFMVDTGAAFTTTGAGIAQMAMRPGFLDQYGMIRGNLQSFLQRGGVAGAQSTIMGGVSGQFGIMVTNFQSLMTFVMNPYLDRLAKVFHFLGDVFAGVLSYLKDHEGEARLASLLFGGAALYQSGRMALTAGNWMRAGLSFARNPHLYLVGGASSAAGAAETGVAAGFASRLGGLAGAAGPWAAVILGLAAVGVAAYELRKHAKDIGASIVDAANWLTDVGGPKLVHAMQNAWTAGIRGLQNMDWGALLRHAIFGRYSLATNGHGSSPFDLPGMPLGLGGIVHMIEGAAARQHVNVHVHVHQH